MEIFNLKEELESHKEFEENVTLLENTLECRDKKVYDLEKKLEKIMEEPPESYSDDDKPSTSKCGTCEYTSDDESEVKIHMRRKHGFKCDVCYYVSDNEESLERHVIVKHEKLNVVDQEFKCDRCGLTLKTKVKLKKHICKVRVKNPSNGSLYMKGWYDCNGCTQVYSSILNKEVAWLHSDNCVIEECAPFKNITKDIEEAIIEDAVEHLRLECFVQDGTILWPKFVKETKLNPSIKITENKEHI